MATEQTDTIDIEAERGDAGGAAPGQQEKDEDQAAWLVELRRRVYTQDFDRVARIMLAMGSTDFADQMHLALAEELQAFPSTYGVRRYCNLLMAMKANDTPPHHAVELWLLLEPWFRSHYITLKMWNIVIDAMVRAGEMGIAKQLVIDLERSGSPHPNAITYTTLMGRVIWEDGAGAAAALYQRIMCKALEPDSITCLLMVQACVVSSPPNLDAAKRWVQKGEVRMIAEETGNRGLKERKPIYLYNTLMAGYARAARVKDCFTLLGCMRSRGIRPNTYTFHILMLTCVKHSPYGIQECRQLLRLMESTDVVPTTANYNVLISSYGTAGQLTAALRVANRMRETGIAWDRFTYLFLIRGVVAAGQVELSLRLLAKMRKDNVRPTRLHYSCAFVGLARAGYYNDATRVFRRLCSINGLVDQRAYNLMICVNCVRRDMDAAVKVFEAMKEAGFEADSMTYRLLIEGFVLTNQFGEALELEESFLQYRKYLGETLLNPQATEMELTKADLELNSERTKPNWKKAYHMLVDAAIWNSESPRGVRLLEDSILQGVPIIPAKHAQMLMNSSPSIRMKAGLLDDMVAYRPLYDRNDPDEVERREAQMTWMRRSPVLQNSRSELVHNNTALTRTSSGSLAGPDIGAETLHVVPPHVFCASFSPVWLSGGAKSSCTPDELLDRILACEGGSSDYYRVVHDHYHATVHRRELTTIRVNPGRIVLGRTAEETTESLQVLFNAFGRPGEPNAPIYLFLRPEAASLDGLLTMLAAGAAHPSSVFVLRPAAPRPVLDTSDEASSKEDAVESSDAEGQSSPDERSGSSSSALATSSSASLASQRGVEDGPAMSVSATKRLAEECKNRGERSLSFALLSTIKHLSAGALLNDKGLVLNDEQVLEGSPVDFEDALRRSLGDVAAGYIGDRFRPSTNSALSWQRWLESHGIRQLIRCEGDTIRLDCSLHKPALSRAEFFRVRSVDARGDLAVDLWMEDDGVVAEFGASAPR